MHCGYEQVKCNTQFFNLTIAIGIVKEKLRINNAKKNRW